MTDGGKVRPDTRDEVLALAATIQRHRMAQITFAHAVRAEYGSSSTQGHQLDRFATLNSSMALALEDLPAMRDLSIRQIHEPQPGAPPTDAAAAMLANPHRCRGADVRGSYRLSPMPPATREAARAYTDERIGLLERTLALIDRRSPYQRHQRATLQQELRTWQRLRDACRERGQ